MKVRKKESNLFFKVVMKKYRNWMLIFLIVFGGGLLLLTGYYTYNLKPVSNNDTLKKVVIEPGSSTKKIAKVLKDNKLIRNENIFVLYIKLCGKTSLKATTYEFSENMGVKKIVSMLEKGNTYNENEVRITFKEGINIRTVASLIEKYTNNSKDLVFSTLKDKVYIKELIEKYWFLDDVILDKNIYYPLEGYLFPNTYSFMDSDVSVKEIFEKMLDQMEKELSKYRNDIEKSKYSVHELITLASIIELEGANSNDRKGVAGVFYNRLDDNWNLGSDVTTYYAVKINMSDRDLRKSEINDCTNKYNTRCTSLIGLPIGPISNPGIESIEAVLNPTKSDYYYFVADKTGKTYFNKTYEEHNKTIQTLKNNDMWFEY